MRFKCKSLNLFVLSIFFIAAGGHFSVAAAQEGEGTEDSSLEETVVVGSRIKGAVETGALPVSVFSSEELEAFGAESVGELFRNLAQAGSVDFNNTSDNPNDARGDVSTVNLRGLGAGNTLVLLNGRRVNTHPFSQDIGSVPRTIVNLNTIPAAAIERVEVLRDGASALYGADATGGVVNTVLDTKYEGLRLGYRNGGADGTGFETNSLNFAGGFNFNEGRTHISVFGTLYQQDARPARERDYSAVSDRRPFLPPDWAGDTQFDNRSLLSPWGRFISGTFDTATREFTPQTVAGLTTVSCSATSSSCRLGQFHIQPDASAGGVDTTQDGLELDDGNLSRNLRYNVNEGRYLSPQIDRFNFFSSLTHDLNNGLTLFAELGIYYSDSYSQRAAQPLSNSLANIVVPRQNYWNPLGPVGSPNRIDDDDIPDEGLDVLVRGWRPVEHGPRQIEVESASYRLLGGIQGQFGNWDWESALFYNYSDAEDQSSNRISKTLMQEALDSDTPDALNLFGGALYENPSEVLDQIRISVTNEAESSLISWDFRASHPAIFSLPAGDAGFAWGAEWRREYYEDDRDHRLDGTTRFVSGAEDSDRSDVAGVSPTEDSDADRMVWSAYGELLVPLLADRPLVHKLTMQLAARFEHLDDISESIFKPKIAFSWFPHHALLLRASYAEGFRAPNLVQLNRGDTSRLSRGIDDFYRQDVTNSDEDNGNDYRRSVRTSNPDLEPEETETYVYGFVWSAPWTEKADFAISIDYWRFEQEDVIDNFGAENELALDFLLRRQGCTALICNPNVLRDAVTPEDQALFDAWNARNPDDQRVATGVARTIIDGYINLDPRTVRGIDYALTWSVPRTRLGTFGLRLEASHLLEFEQKRDSLQPLAGVPGIDQGDLEENLREDRVKVNSNPRWRSSAVFSWRKKAFGGAVSWRYIDEFEDFSARNDTTNANWLVEEYSILNANFDYRFDLWGDTRARLRLGVNNIEDEEPPLADQGRGYFSSYHSDRGRFYYVSFRADLR